MVWRDNLLSVFFCDFQPQRCSQLACRDVLWWRLLSAVLRRTDNTEVNIYQSSMSGPSKQKRAHLSTLHNKPTMQKTRMETNLKLLWGEMESSHQLLLHTLHSHSTSVHWLVPLSSGINLLPLPLFFCMIGVFLGNILLSEKQILMRPDLHAFLLQSSTQSNVNLESLFCNLTSRDLSHMDILQHS